RRTLIIPSALAALAHQTSGIYPMLLATSSLPALPFLIWRSQVADVVERRRVKLFVVGLVAGAAPLIVIVSLEGIIPSFHRFMRNYSSRYWSGFVVYPALMSIPISTTYAVLVQRVLDVRLIIRKALQYALARYTVLAATLTPLAVL